MTYEWTFEPIPPNVNQRWVRRRVGDPVGINSGRVFRNERWSAPTMWRLSGNRYTLASRFDSKEQAMRLLAVVERMWGRP